MTMLYSHKSVKEVVHRLETAASVMMLGTSGFLVDFGPLPRFLQLCKHTYALSSNAWATSCLHAVTAMVLTVIPKQASNYLFKGIIQAQPRILKGSLKGNLCLCLSPCPMHLVDSKHRQPKCEAA